MRGGGAQTPRGPRAPRPSPVAGRRGAREGCPPAPPAAPGTELQEMLSARSHCSQGRTHGSITVLWLPGRHCPPHTAARPALRPTLWAAQRGARDAAAPRVPAPRSKAPGGSPGRVQALPCSWSLRCPAQPGQGHSPPPGVDGPPHRRPHSQLPPRSLQTQWANCQAPAGARAVPHGTVAWLARAVSLVAWGS